jgi:hypothetical protein
MGANKLQSKNDYGAAKGTVAIDMFKCHISFDRSFISSIRSHTMEVPYPSPAEFEALGQQLAGYTISTSNKINDIVLSHSLVLSL